MDALTFIQSLFALNCLLIHMLLLSFLSLLTLSKCFKFIDEI